MVAPSRLSSALRSVAGTVRAERRRPSKPPGEPRPDEPLAALDSTARTQAVTPAVWPDEPI